MGGGLSGWRKEAVEAQVHGLGGVMVGPRVRKNEYGPGASNVLTFKERDGLGEASVVNFGEGCGAEIKRTLESGHQLLFAVCIGEFWTFRRGDTGDFGTEIVVGLRDVQGEMAKGDLVGGRLEGKFIGGHGFRGCRHSFGIAGETVAQGVGKGRCGWSGGGGSSLRERDCRCESEKNEGSDEAVHEASRNGVGQITPQKNKRASTFGLCKSKGSAIPQFISRLKLTLRSFAHLLGCAQDDNLNFALRWKTMAWFTS